MYPDIQEHYSVQYYTMLQRHKHGKIQTHKYTKS